VLRGTQIRKSLDLVEWEAAQATVREWESVGIEGAPISFAEVKGKYLIDVERRKLAPPTEKKYNLLTIWLSKIGAGGLGIKGRTCFLPNPYPTRSSRPKDAPLLEVKFRSSPEVLWEVTHRRLVFPRWRFRTCA